MKEKSKTDNFDILAREFKIGSFSFPASRETATFCKIELKTFLTKQPKQFVVVLNRKGSNQATKDADKLRTTINFDDLKRFDVRTIDYFVYLEFPHSTFAFNDSALRSSFRLLSRFFLRDLPERRLRFLFHQL